MCSFAPSGLAVTKDEQTQGHAWPFGPALALGWIILAFQARVALLSICTLLLIAPCWHIVKGALILCCGSGWANGGIGISPDAAAS
jgi:hypothetical protein